VPRCYANPNPTFQPAMRLISAITNSFPAVVTTSFAHQYKTGTIVRLDIPVACGMQQANQAFGPIEVLSTTTFSMPINTTQYDVFAIPVLPDPPDINCEPHINICAQVEPIGEVNDTLKAATQNVLPIV
jgi:hypothetical protein